MNTNIKRFILTVGIILCLIYMYFQGMSFNEFDSINTHSFGKCPSLDQNEVEQSTIIARQNSITEFNRIRRAQHEYRSTQHFNANPMVGLPNFGGTWGS